jgi:hypothetical protein
LIILLGIATFVKEGLPGTMWALFLILMVISPIINLIALNTCQSKKK